MTHQQSSAEDRGASDGSLRRNLAQGPASQLKAYGKSGVKIDLFATALGEARKLLLSNILQAFDLQRRNRSPEDAAISFADRAVVKEWHKRPLEAGC